MEADIKNLRDNPQTYLLEGLHSVAYQGALGNPLVRRGGGGGGGHRRAAAGGYGAEAPAGRWAGGAGGTAGTAGECVGRPRG